MPSKPEVLKERRLNDPEFAARTRSYAAKYREANRDKERERHRLVKAKLREKDREAYNAKMREYHRVNVYPRKSREAAIKKQQHPEYSERVSTRSLLTQAEYWRHWKMKKTYGIGIFDYYKMYESQCGKCSICGIERPNKGKDGLVVDHNHSTGRVRELLCVHCNTGLGQLRDDVGRLQKAIEYLNKFKE